MWYLSCMLRSVLLFISGIALFLFGMTKLSTGMQLVISGRLREYVGFSVTKKPYGLLAGTLATVLFQSSSATTLLTVSMVSAGLISFYHSLSIILGADIGTTLTVQLVVWNVTSISPILIFAGGILYFLGKDRWKVGGEMILYLGLIFYGLGLVGQAVAPLEHNRTLMRFFLETKNPILGIAIGLVFTGIVHASAIPVAILVILGQQGLIGIDNALPIVLGANVGTTVTALMGSMVSNIDGKRTALSHLLSKSVGVIICLALLPFITALLKQLSSSVPQQIALGHFLFNLFVAGLFLLILGPFSRLVERILPGQSRTLSIWPQYLDRQCLASTSDALACVKKELKREMALSQEMFTASLGLIAKFNEARKRDIMYIELIVDNLQSEIVNYLWNISCFQLSAELSKKLFVFSSIVYDIERIGDRSTNLVELAESRHRRNAYFSESGYNELSTIGALLGQTIEETTSLLERRDEEAIRMIMERHKNVTRLIKEATESHLQRFYSKVCEAEAGPIFVDMLVNLKWISDHCQAIAENMAGLRED
jgi:phosphate:Na+ symporter